MPAPTAAAPTQSRIAEIDGVRGAAILLVVVWHYVFAQVQTVPGSTPAYATTLLSLTWTGVDFFFVLSGFLIGGTLIDNRLETNYFRAFYVRRACRIFPLYCLVLGVFGIALLAGAGAGSAAWTARLFGDPLPFWSYATYLQNFAMAGRGGHGPDWMGVTWSLALEEQFYLMLPLLVRWSPPWALPWLLGSLAIGAPVFRTISYVLWPHGGFIGFLLLPGRLDALLAGALGAYAVRQPWALTGLQRRLGAVRLCVIGAGVGMLALLVLKQGIGSVGMSLGGHTLIAIFGLGVILLAVISEGGWNQRLFRHRSLVWVGTVSYGVYLLHQPVSGLLHGIFRGLPPAIASWTDASVTACALVCTLALATLSERFFERPIVAYGRRTRYRG